MDRPSATAFAAPMAVRAGERFKVILREDGYVTRIRSLTLCLIAVFAMTAVIAASAQASINRAGGRPAITEEQKEKFKEELEGCKTKYAEKIEALNGKAEEKKGIFAEKKEALKTKKEEFNGKI